eukprot:TRINITY_DN62881_c0_g1_i1.p1 TRINITY_DN62881_c0_g1~~TRINITY_DN62881_c0_g1_i1.p1  ORF type:complete len:405 (+),score=126.88 TRINITY_DN62881_c0_g1_i1:40-1215(+)
MASAAVARAGDGAAVVSKPPKKAANSLDVGVEESGAENEDEDPQNLMAIFENTDERGEALVNVLKQACSRNKAIEKQEMRHQKKKEDFGSATSVTLKSNDGEVTNVTKVPQGANVTNNAVNQYEAERIRNAELKENTQLHRFCNGKDDAWRPDFFFTDTCGQADIPPWPIRPAEVFSNPSLCVRIMAHQLERRKLRKQAKKQKKAEKEAARNALKKEKKSKKEAKKAVGEMEAVETTGNKQKKKKDKKKKKEKDKKDKKEDKKEKEKKGRKERDKHMKEEEDMAKEEAPAKKRLVLKPGPGDTSRSNAAGGAGAAAAANALTTGVAIGSSDSSSFSDAEAAGATTGDAPRAPVDNDGKAIVVETDGEDSSEGCGTPPLDSQCSSPASGDWE